MLGGVYGLLNSLFDIVMMVADEASLVDGIDAFKPEVVVIDLSLPHEGETSIARRLVERTPELRLIVLSIHDEPTVVNQLLEVGIAGFVLKRAAATDLVPAVTEVRRGGVYVSPALQWVLSSRESRADPGE